MPHLTNFSFEFVYEIFTEDTSLRFRYQLAKKSKMTKNSNQGGGGGLPVADTCLLPTLAKHLHVARQGLMLDRTAATAQTPWFREGDKYLTGAQVAYSRTICI